MRSLLSSLGISPAAILSMLLMIAFPSLTAVGAEREPICDMQAAIDYCREAPLDKIEGIWEFPEDNTVVLIRKQPSTRRQYELIIVSTPDCRLHPGEKIGELTPSIDSNKLRLSLFGAKKNGVLSDPNNCVATFNDTDGTIKVEKRKLRIAFNVSRFLPKFWRILSLFKLSDPASRLPEGLIRIYPAKDGNGFEKGMPYYL